MGKSKRILIFNVNWLGDVLFSTAVIRNLRYNFPNAFIACVIPSRCYPILKDNPHLNEIIIFDEKDRHKGVFDKLKFVQLLKAKKFDVVFLLHRSFTRALICRLADIPERYGYYTKKRGFLLTKKIIAPDKDSIHRIDYYLNIIERAGIKIEDRFSDFFISEKDALFIDEYLRNKGVREGDFLIGVNPGGNWHAKRWPKEYWAILSDILMEDLGAKVIITGGYFDLPLAKDIQGLMKAKPIIACNDLNIKQLGALCRKLDLFITADTGPLHIANSVKTKKIIALFGPTSIKVTGSYPDYNVIVLQKDVGCILPCYKVKCPDNRCMKAITPQEVAEKVKLIKKREA